MQTLAHASGYDSLHVELARYHVEDLISTAESEIKARAQRMLAEKIGSALASKVALNVVVRIEVKEKEWG